MKRRLPYSAGESLEMMNLVKELRIRGEDINCLHADHGFNIKIQGLMAELKQKNLYVKISDVNFPQDFKQSSYKIYYGKMCEEVTIQDFKSITVKYYCLEDLSLQLQIRANEMIKSVCCSDGSHEKHVCEKTPIKKLIKIEYQENRFIINNGSGQMLIICKNLSEAIGFDGGKEKNFRNESFVVLDGQIAIGDYVKFYSLNERFNHVILDGITTRFSCDGKNYNVLFSYDYDKKNSSCHEACVKPFVLTSDILCFQIVDDEMKPKKWSDNKSLNKLRFTMQMFIL